jgi:hypothetical protein
MEKMVLQGWMEIQVPMALLEKMELRALMERRAAKALAPLRWPSRMAILEQKRSGWRHLLERPVKLALLEKTALLVLTERPEFKAQLVLTEPPVKLVQPAQRALTEPQVKLALLEKTALLVLTERPEFKALPAQPVQRELTALLLRQQFQPMPEIRPR